MSKFFNDDSARCLICEGRLLSRGLAGNDKHLYTIGTLYKCLCGASSVWTNSIRNPVALLAFLDGTSTRYYQGFCNDLFDGKRGRTIMPLRSMDFAGERQRGQVYGYDDTDVAVVWSSRFWSEQVGPEKLIEWYAKHADVIRRAVAATLRSNPEAPTEGKTPNGLIWALEEGGEVPWKTDMEVDTFVRVTNRKGKTVCGVYADRHGDTLYVEYAVVFDPKLRRKGVYSDVLEGLSEHYNIVSDQDHNNAAASIYKRLGAQYSSRDERYTLRKKAE